MANRQDGGTEAALERLRSECADWPAVSEGLGWGNPTFKANGKAFAVLDGYKGGPCIWLRCDGAEREALLAGEGFFAAPYDRGKSAICRKLEGIDWDELRPLLKRSYERALIG